MKNLLLLLTTMSKVDTTPLTDYLLNRFSGTMETIFKTREPYVQLTEITVNDV